MARDLRMSKAKYTKSTSPDGKMARSQAWEATSVKGRRLGYGGQKKYGNSKTFKEVRSQKGRLIPYNQGG